MASDDPPVLEVGTPVSARFKGAFCEAHVKSVKKQVKCKVWFKDTQSSVVVNDDVISGELKMNGAVFVRQPDRGTLPGTIMKINDHSLYTVVFDDGDERTLRRTNICLMGERHFQEDETLDNLPLTDPENFGTPVLTGSDKKRRRKRINSQASLDDEESGSESPSSKKCALVDKDFLGKVVCIEQGERKKSWFPALGLKSESLSEHDNSLTVQSFKDGKKMQVSREDIKEFSKDKEPLMNYIKGDTKYDPILRSAIEKALAYHDLGELPKGWSAIDAADEKGSSDDDIPTTMPVLNAEAKAFADKVMEFYEKQGISLQGPAMVNGQEVNLHKLYQLVVDCGGMEEVSNPEWRAIYDKLGLTNVFPAVTMHMKNLYRKYLLPYEEHCKSNMSRTPNLQRARQSPRRSPTRENLEKSSVVSESDSEPDRSRTKRSTRSKLKTDVSSVDSGEKFKSKAGSDHSGNELVEGADDSTSSSRDYYLDHDSEMKLSEAEDIDVVNSPRSSIASEDIVDDEKRALLQGSKYKIGCHILVRYGKGKNQTEYDAKILDIDRDEVGDIVYFIHYTGWNTRYDEWVKDERIACVTTASSKRRNTVPPTPLSKIAKEPPPVYHRKFEASGLSPLPLRYPGISKSSPPYSVDKAPLPAIKIPAAMPITVKTSPTQPLGAATSPPTLITENLFIPEPVKPSPPQRQQHRPKPITEALFIPDIKPSPVKPRLTRNSMQDTFLLTALEESIGSQPKMSVSADSVAKSESSTFQESLAPEPPLEQLVNTQPPRPIRSQNMSPRSDCETSTKDGKDEVLISIKKEPDKIIDSGSSVNDSDALASTAKVAVQIEPLDRKESSKEATVKKWIEESNKVMCKGHRRGQEAAESPTELKPSEAVEEKAPEKNRRGRKPKSSSLRTGRRRRNLNNNDSDNISDDDDLDKDDDKEDDEAESLCDVVSPTLANEVAMLSDLEQPSQTAQALSDFCDIVDSVHKLHSEEMDADVSKHFTGDGAQCDDPLKDPMSPKKRKMEKRRRQRSKSSGTAEEEIKSPRDKRKAPALDYKVDFISDLPNVLASKDPVERILIMQCRLNDMRKLYCKLRSEVASIDRRKRRKLRKQFEAEMARREACVDVR